MRIDTKSNSCVINFSPQVIAHLATNFSLQISSIVKRKFLFTSKEEF